MVTLSKESDGQSRVDQKESNIVEKTVTCVGDDGDRPDIPPTNHVHISKHEAPVNGRFILDLSLWPPPPPPGIASNTSRKNVILHTTSGPVTAEIWIKRNEGTNLIDIIRSKGFSLDLCSDNGPVRAIVHDFFSPNKTSRVFPSINMNIRSNHGDVYLSLPRCFRGPITICTGDDRIAFSPAFEKCTVLTSDVQGVRVYFVGDRPQGGKWGISGSRESVEDILDEISVDGRHTSVRVNWEGEGDVPAMVPNPWQALVSGAERFFATGRLF